jgi:hypothetical protein
MMNVPSNPRREVEDLRRAIAQDRTDIQRLWKLAGTSSPKQASQPPWGLGAEETPLESCLTCSFPDIVPQLTITTSRTPTDAGDLRNLVIAQMISLQPLPLTVFSETVFPSGSYFRAYRYTNNSPGFSWSGLPITSYYFEIDCQYNISSGSRVAFLQGRIFTGSTLLSFLFVVQGQAINSSCSPLLIISKPGSEPANSDSGGEIKYLIEITE